MKQYRSECAWAFVAAKPMGWKPGPVEVKIEYRVHRGCTGAYHPKDQDNAQAACKALLDGGRDAGVFISDAHGNLRIADFKLITTEREVERAGGPGVFITVRRK